MEADGTKGEYIWHDLVRRTGTTVEEGNDHIMLQTVFAVAQRHMDQKAVTPINIRVGALEPFEWKKAPVGNGNTEDLTGVQRLTEVVFRPGKSDQSFAEWFCGRSLNKETQT